MEEDSGERDEGEQLDMGSLGTTSTQHKPMAHFGRGLKAGFHWRRSRSWSRSRKSAYDLVKIENRSHKRSHKFDGIGVGRIRTFPFLPIPFTMQEIRPER